MRRNRRANPHDHAGPKFERETLIFEALPIMLLTVFLCRHLMSVVKNVEGVSGKGDITSVPSGDGRAGARASHYLRPFGRKCEVVRRLLGV